MSGAWVVFQRSLLDTVLCSASRQLLEEHAWCACCALMDEFLIRSAAVATLAAAGACLMHLPLTGRAAIAAGCGKGVTA